MKRNVCHTSLPLQTIMQLSVYTLEFHFISLGTFLLYPTPKLLEEEIPNLIGDRYFWHETIDIHNSRVFLVVEKANIEPRNASWHLYKGILKANQEPKEMVYCTWTFNCGEMYVMENTIPCSQRKIWVRLYVYDNYSDFLNLLRGGIVKGMKTNGLYISVGENQLT